MYSHKKISLRKQIYKDYFNRAGNENFRKKDTRMDNQRDFSQLFANTCNEKENRRHLVFTHLNISKVFNSWSILTGLCRRRPLTKLLYTLWLKIENHKTSFTLVVTLMRGFQTIVYNIIKWSRYLHTCSLCSQSKIFTDKSFSWPSIIH